MGSQSRKGPLMAQRYTLFIGNKNWSSWSLRPWLVLKMAKLPFEEVMVPLRRPETKGHIFPHSPSGKVPALRIGTGKSSYVVWDSLAICETLAERHAQARLWPANAGLRGEARSIVAEMHSGFSHLRQTLPMEIAARRPTPAMTGPLENEIARVIAIWTSALRKNAKKNGFLFGRFSIADAFYAPVATRFETYGVPLPPLARAYVKRILALEPMQEWRMAAEAEAAGQL